MDYSIVLPSKPRIVSEEGNAGVYEIDGFYPGYGHTLGNSLRRIILSSIPGAAITAVKIDGVPHEFATMAGVKEDVISIILNLKKVRIRVIDNQPHTLTLSMKGVKEVTAGDIVVPGQVEILNPTQKIATLTDKSASLDIELSVETGLGYVPKEVIQKDRSEIGSIALDAIFTPIRRAHYEIENMRVGDKTNFNRLRLSIETDGTLTPREALERSITVMIQQLKAIIGFKEEETAIAQDMAPEVSQEASEDVMKTRIEELELTTRTANALTQGSIRTLGGLVRKAEGDILSIEGIGQKGLDEIKDSLKRYGLTLRKNDE